mmetsp:Transcript_124581/g.278056  ORF Transcript_124581/g.278056 Transcript_124581/m.278056 type:complete len:216 (-) Transcript_124581:84-731(-)
MVGRPLGRHCAPHLPERLPVDPANSGWCLSQNLLHEPLLRRTEQCSVELEWGCECSDLPGAARCGSWRRAHYQLHRQALVRHGHASSKALSEEQLQLRVLVQGVLSARSLGQGCRGSGGASGPSGWGERHQVRALVGTLATGGGRWGGRGGGHRGRERERGPRSGRFGSGQAQAQGQGCDGGAAAAQGARRRALAPGLAGGRERACCTCRGRGRC